MNKKQYQQPTLHIVNLNIENLMGSLSNPGVTSVSSGDVFNSKITGGSGTARGRDFGGWDDDE